MADAPSVRAALTEASRLWPGRDDEHDGTIGDAHHREAKSDHNPGARGLVHAFDLTHDPASGCDCRRNADWLRSRVLDGNERRVRYVIFARRIFNAAVSPAWRPYGGSNPHDRHMHVSIHETPEAEQDRSPWWPPFTGPTAAYQPSPWEDDMPLYRDQGDAEVSFVRDLYLTHLLREPESQFAVLSWVSHLRAHGVDATTAAIADSREGQDVRARRRAHLGLA